VPPSFLSYHSSLLNTSSYTFYIIRGHLYLTPPVAIEDNHVRALLLSDGVNDMLDNDSRRKSFEVSSDMEAGISAILDSLTDESIPEHAKFVLRDYSCHIVVT